MQHIKGPSVEAGKTQQYADVPPLTDSIIWRAKQALAMSQDPRIHRARRETLEHLEYMSTGEAVPKINAKWRQRIISRILNTIVHLDIKGHEHIPSGPAIIAPNHTSHFDPFLILSILPPEPYCYLVGDTRALFNTWWKRVIIHIADGVIPIDRIWKEERAVLLAATEQIDLADLAANIQRETDDGQSLSTLRQLDRIVSGLLKQNNSLLIFPEGRLGDIEGTLYRPLKRGTVIYAIRAGVPIVPVGISGAREIYFGARITIQFGAPLTFPIMSHPSPRILQGACNELANRIEDLLVPDLRPVKHQPGKRLLQRVFW
jgi:1-acyl-sn-glycerol-3-phosphate acyltransferase